MPDNEVRKSKYEETRRRISRYINNSELADREIIEYLAEEIEQYRNKITILESEIKKQSMDIDVERDTLNCASDYGIEEYTVERWYEDGLLIKEEIKPVHK